MALGTVNSNGSAQEGLVVLFSVDENDIVADKTHAEILEETNFGNPVFAHCPFMNAYNIPLVYVNVQMAVFSMAFVQLGENAVVTVVVKSDDTVEAMTTKFSTKDELEAAVAGIKAVSIDERTELENGTDLNTLTTPGCYRVPTVLLAMSLENLPDGFEDLNFLLDVYKYNSAGYITQRAYPTTGAFYAVRNWRGDTWGEWDISYSGKRKPTPADIGAVPKVRTINGKDLSANIKLTADDVGAAEKDHTHDEYAEADHTHSAESLSAVRISSFYEDINTLIDDGHYRVGANTNLPDSLWYGQVIVVKGNDSNTVCQIGVSYTTGKMMSRAGSISDNVVTWTDWTEGGSAAQVHLGTIGTSWEEDSETGVKTQTVAIDGITADHTANVDNYFASTKDSDGYAAFVEQQNQYLTYITNGYAETVAGGIKFTIFGDAPTVSIPIVVEVV